MRVQSVSKQQDGGDSCWNVITKPMFEKGPFDLEPMVAF
jgi:hypothetical protein